MSEQQPADRPAVTEITADPTVCRCAIGDMVSKLRAGPQSRAMSLAITKLEEAGMWLNEHLRLS